MEQGGYLLYSLIFLVLVVSSLAARRVPMGQMMKMALMWIGIFIILFIIFSFRTELSYVWDRVKSDIAGTSNQSSNGQEIILTQRDDGHFWLRASVNGVPIDFLVDSGATAIAMSTADAEKANIPYDPNSIPVLTDTANGVSKNYRATIDVLQTEDATFENVNVLVAPTLGDTNLLGMSYLNRLQSWRVEGNRMILQP